MSEYIIFVLGFAGKRRQDVGDPSGKYVVDYDAGAYDGGGFVSLSDDRSKAKRFPDLADAFEFWRQDFGIRSDGKPNRPLTAFTVEIIPVDEQEAIEEVRRVRDEHTDT